MTFYDFISFDITTEKWRLMRMRNKKANKKIVKEGVMAPTKWVISLLSYRIEFRPTFFGWIIRLIVSENLFSSGV